MKRKMAIGERVPADAIHPNLTGERLQWIELIDRLGPLEWLGQIADKPAAHCREHGWTAVRIERGRALHELTREGQTLLVKMRRLDKHARAALNEKQEDRE